MKTKDMTCVFDVVYYFNDVAKVNGESVGAARFHAGCELAQLFDVKGDLVAAVPSTAVEVAKGYSHESGIPFCEIISVKPNALRSFGQASQEAREKVVNEKFIFQPDDINGKRIILLDDSIVRGTTMKIVVKKLRDLGAKEIHVLSASPAVVNTCETLNVFDKEELISNNRTLEQVRKMLGVDTLHYLPIEKIAHVYGTNQKICSKCFE